MNPFIRKPEFQEFASVGWVSNHLQNCNRDMGKREGGGREGEREGESERRRERGKVGNTDPPTKKNN